MSKPGSFLREPLVHFFVVGALLFGWSAYRAPEDVPRDEIRITAGQIENIAKLFERTWRRAPTQDELATLIDNRVREEVLFREAKALGLDRDDVIIRRRLVQKYGFLTDDLTSLRQPDEAELQAFLEAEADRYSIGAKISYRQVFLSREGTADDIDGRLERLRAELAAGGDPGLLGDPIDLPARMERTDHARIAATFGPQFAASLPGLPVGTWSGPVPSAYGYHLVFVEAREDGRLPELAEVRTAVERDWQEAEKRKFRALLLDRLRQNYDIVIEQAGATITEPAS